LHEIPHPRGALGEDLVCCGASRMASKTRRIVPCGNASWKRSLIELTKMRRGFSQRSG